MSGHRDQVSPIPREARRYQGRHAGVVTRLAAAVLDAVAVAVILLSGYGLVAVVAFLVEPLRFSLPRPSWALNLSAALALTVVYLTAGWSAGGRTYGMSIMGLRVTGPSGRPLRLGTAVVRALACVVFPVGLLWSVANARHRSAQDVLLRTEVVYDWSRTGSSTTDEDHRREARQVVPGDRREGGPMLIVLVIPAVLMIGALLMERLERIMFSPKVSTSDTDADR